MDKDNKLCIICCLPFVLINQQQSHDKISQFCEQISRNDDVDINNSGEKNGLSTTIFNCHEELLKLDASLGMSVCCSCYTEMTELLTCKENKRLTEDHVICLQMEIIKGLRDLEKIMEKTKCHEENLKKKVQSSDELSLKIKLNKDMELDCLPFKLREWILKDDPVKNGRVKGNLWISGTEKTVEQANVKMEIEETFPNFDDDASNVSWNAKDEIDEEPKKKTNSKHMRCSKKEPQNFQVRETSTMTLRTRSSKKSKEEIIIPNSIPVVATKRKLKKKPKSGQTLKPVLHKVKKEYVQRPVLQCDLCSFSTRIVPSFEQHMRHHENEAPPESKSLECPHCASKFSTQQFFNFHKKCHEGLYKLSCDVCSKLIPTLLLEDHIKSHISAKGEEDTPLKIIYCQDCYFCCTSRQTYLTHLHRHKSKTTKGKFTCDICSEEYSMPRGLLDHFDEKHGEAVTKIRCDFPNCGKLFTTKNYLMTHKWYHSKDKKIPCSECDMKFPTQAHLEKHFRTHTDERPFGCNLCDKRFRWKLSLIGHQRSEHGAAAKLKCETCGKEYGERRRLDYHMKGVHGDGNERFPCEICGNLFTLKHSLKSHMSRAHGGNDRKCTCDQCGKRFKLESDLKHHMKLHSGVKNWKCEYCGKAFVRKENLRDHLRVHTGERPFVCDICGKDFNQASALRTHKMNQHPI